MVCPVHAEIDNEIVHKQANSGVVTEKRKCQAKRCGNKYDPAVEDGENARQSFCAEALRLRAYRCPGFNKKGIGMLSLQI